MKGLVVIICGPSQFGKDATAEQLIERIPNMSLTWGGVKVPASYATVFKVREKRVNDADHIKCVSAYEEIPVPKDDRIEGVVYGQAIVYDEREIDAKVKNGEIVFIATCSIDLAREVKEQYQDQCFSVCIKAEAMKEKDMVRVDLQRHGYSPNNPTEEQFKESRARVSKRLEYIEGNKDQYNAFVQDEKLGPDCVYNNWYHFIREIPYLRNYSREDFDDLEFSILDIHHRINKGEEWKDKYSLSKKEREEYRDLSLFTLMDEYARRNHERRSKY